MVRGGNLRSWFADRTQRGESAAQQTVGGDLPPLPRYVPPTAPRAGQYQGLQRVAYQNAPPTPAPTVPPPPGVPAVPAPPGMPAVPPPPGDATVPAPPVAPSTTEPLRSNTDLALPRSEREGGGGEPTEAAAATEAAAEAKEEPAAKDPTKLLMNCARQRGRQGQGLRLAPEQLHRQRQRPRRRTARTSASRPTTWPTSGRATSTT